MLIATKKCQDKKQTNKQTNKQKYKLVRLGANNGVSKELALKIKTAPNVL